MKQLTYMINAKTHTYKYSQGFTLVEMAVVLVIVGLLLASLIVPISSQIDQRNYFETRKSLEEVKEALMGYGLTRGYLPCPAISATNGLEDRTAGICNKRVGFLPWAELGVSRADGWGHLYRYTVTLAYANSPSALSLSPLTPRDITIQTRDSAGAIVNLTSAADIPVAVFSQGKNSNSAVDTNGNIIPDSSATNDDEDANSASVGTVLISREISENSATLGGEFDDVVVWISPTIYVSRMVSVGRLP